MEELETIYNKQYPDEVINAVRYGYQYRIEAELHTNDNLQIYNALPEASGILHWIAQMIISGVTFDLIKTHVLRLLEKMKDMQVVIPEDVNKVLLDEDELRRFVKYVDEFDKKTLSTSDKEAAYIREEIVANYIGNRAGEIFEKHHRLLNREEWLAITRAANEYADYLLNHTVDNRDM